MAAIRSDSVAEGMAALLAALQDAGCAPGRLLRLHLFLRDRAEGAAAEGAAAALREAGVTEGIALSILPLPEQAGQPPVSLLAWAYDAPGERLTVAADDLPLPFARAVAAGPFAVTGAIGEAAASPGDLLAQSEATMRRLEALIAEGGGSLSHAVKINNYYHGGAAVADWSAPAKIRGRFFPEPGPAATGMPLPAFEDPALRTRIEVAALRAENGKAPERRWVWPEGHWDWPIDLPYKHGVSGGGLIFIGGQVMLTPEGEVLAADDAVAQTQGAIAAIARILDGFGQELSSLLCLVAYHAAGPDADLVPEARRLCREAGADPIILEVSLPALAYPGMIVEIEAFAEDREGGRARAG